MAMCANDEYDFILAPIVILVLVIKSASDKEDIIYHRYDSYHPQINNQYLPRKRKASYYPQYKEDYKHIVTKCKRNVIVALDKNKSKNE